MQLLRNSAKPKPYLLIRRTDKNIGLGSYILLNLGHIHYAVENNMIPVVDMQSYPNTYLENHEVGKVNAWELYFRQPANIGVADVKLRDCRVVDTAPAFVPCDNMDFLTNHKLVQYWQKFTRKYLVLTKEIQAHMDEVYLNITGGSEKRILGVLCRGTDYLSTKPYGHPVQPEVDDVMAKAEQVMKQYNCSYLYLATEDKGILDRFREKFGDRLLYNSAMRYGDTQDKRLSEFRFNRDRDAYLKGLEYLESLVILSRCNCLIGGRTNGSLCALMMSEGYEYQYFWNLGRYRLDDKYSILSP
ncbi:MAG: hypothetical protein KBB11_02315 [Bacteroidales bacterium]|nr:hypothetical protein [Bacteroidales bacterium]HOY39192.1 hypothetical protein [Bacteroidales bacterium]HQP03324.1 hypothetical protein [Bacteroidales bacterium]